MKHMCPRCWHEFRSEPKDKHCCRCGHNWGPGSRSVHNTGSSGDGTALIVYGALACAFSPAVGVTMILLGFLVAKGSD